MGKSTIFIITLALAISFAAHLNAQSCARVGYQDRDSSARSSKCSSDNRCCNATDTERIAELFRRQRERCWTTGFNNSRNAFRAFIERFEDLIEQIVRRAAIDRFGTIPTTPSKDGDYYDDVARINGEDIGDMARDYIRNNTNIELVRERFESVACSVLASRVLVSRLSTLQRNYSICGGCLCDLTTADNPQIRLGTLVRQRLESAWLLYLRHLQRLRTIYNQIRNISAEAVPSRQIVQLCDDEAIRLLGCRRCAGFDEGTCDRVCTSVVYFCREAYRRFVLAHRNAPRTFLNIATALRGDSRNEFSPDNTRDTVSRLERELGGLVDVGFSAFQRVNMDIRNVSIQRCIFKNTDSEKTDSTDRISPDRTKQSCRPPCNNCNGICNRNLCNGNANNKCTPPTCNGCSPRGTAKCQCHTTTRNCPGRRRRDVENIYRRATTDKTLPEYITTFYNLANAANVASSGITFNDIFQRDCVCGRTLDRYREIALNRTSSCYNPLGEFTLDGDNFRSNPIFTRLNSTERTMYEEGVSVAALQGDLDTFEMQVTEGSNAEMMSYSIVTALMSLMLLILFS